MSYVNKRTATCECYNCGCIPFDGVASDLTCFIYRVSEADVGYYHLLSVIAASGWIRPLQSKK